MPIHSVFGPIDPAELGQTSMHEHLSICIAESCRCCVTNTESATTWSRR